MRPAHHNMKSADMKPIKNINTSAYNSFPAIGDFCRLLITFANSLDPDQAIFVGPDLDPNCLKLWCYSWKTFLKKVNFNRQQKKHAKLPSIQRVNPFMPRHTGKECRPRSEHVTAHNEPSHQDLHCLQKYRFGSKRLKGLNYSACIRK